MTILEDMAFTKASEETIEAVDVATIVD